MISDGRIAQWIKRKLDLIGKHWKDFLAIGIIAIVSILLWIYFEYKFPNKIFAEIFKAIFLASLIGFFIEGSSIQDEFKATIANLSKNQEIILKNLDMSAEKKHGRQLQKILTSQEIVINRQSCCGVLLPGIRCADIDSVYFPLSDEFDPIPRMRQLIAGTKDILWVKHVSMFQIAMKENGLLNEVFREHFKNISDIKLLLINPDSEQAKMRAYRELLIKHPNSTKSYADYLNANEWKDSPLFLHTTMSIRELIDYKKDFDSTHNRSVKTGFEIAKYFSAPDAAMIITDHAILYEPLHFGDNPLKQVIQKGTKEPILRGKMPVFEFKRQGPGGVYELLKDNFIFVQKNFSEVI